MKTKFSLLKRIIALLLMVILITPSYSSNVYALPTDSTPPPTSTDKTGQVGNTLEGNISGHTKPGPGLIYSGVGVTIAQIKNCPTLEAALYEDFNSPFKGVGAVDFVESISNWQNGIIVPFITGNREGTDSTIYVADGSSANIHFYGHAWINKSNDGGSAQRNSMKAVVSQSANIIKLALLNSGKSVVEDLLPKDIIDAFQLLRSNGTYNDDTIHSIATGYIFGKSACTLADLDSALSSVSSETGYSVESLEIVMYTITIWYISTLQYNGAALWEDYAKNLNKDGSESYYILNIYEIPAFWKVVSDAATDYGGLCWVGTLGATATSLGFNNNHDGLSHMYVNRAKAEFNGGKEYLDMMQADGTLTGTLGNALYSNKFTAITPEAMAGQVLGISSIKTPIMNSKSYRTNDDYYDSSFWGYCFNKDGSFNGSPFRGFGCIYNKWGSSGSGLSIEVEPKDRECELKSGLLLDDNGRVKVASSAVEASLKATSNISLTVTVRKCSGESKGLTSTDVPINLTVNGKSGNGTVTTSLTYQDAMQLATGSTWAEFTSQVTSDGSKSAEQYYQAEATWVIDGVTIKCEAGEPAHGNPYLCHDYASWNYGSPNGKDWFEYHSGMTPNAWAQIKANECKREDWEVLEGIPSTENLFVASGGQLFSIDVAGTFEHQEDITRTTTIQVNISNVWETLTPCSLNCGGHSYSCGSFNYSNSAGCGGSHSGCSSCGGGAWSDSGAPHLKAEGKPPVMKPHPCGGNSMSHSGSASVSFNCTTGTWTKSHSGKGSFEITPSSSLCSCGQHYIGTCGYKLTDCGGKVVASGTHTYSCPGVIDEGYTTGRGCSCSGNHNHQHPQARTYIWRFEEKIPQILYLNITDYAIYGLCKTATVAVNGAILESSANNQSALQEVGMTSWNLQNGTNNASVPWATYANGNGRLYFTQYKNIPYKNGAGWLSSAAACTNGTPFYWLGDSIVVINIEADNNNGNFKGDGTTMDAVRHGGGKSDGDFSQPDSATNTWISGKYTIGDYMPGDACVNEAACVASQWMHHQSTGKDAHCLVVSDQLAIKAKDAGGWKSQDLVNAMYDMREPWAIFGTASNGGDAYGANYCTSGNQGGVVRRFTYTMPAGITKDTLFSFSSPYNFRGVFNDSDIMKLGFTGSPGSAYRASNSYTEYCFGNKVKSANIDGPTSLSNPSAMAANRSEGGWLTQSNLVMGSGSGSGGGEGSNYPYMSVAYRTRYQLESAGSSGGSQSFEGFHDVYTYEAFGSDSLKSDRYGSQNVTSNPPSGVSLSATNSTSANLQQYNIPMVMSAKFDIKDWIENGEYSEPVTVNGWWGNCGTYIESGLAPKWTSSLNTRKQQSYTTASGAKIGYTGLNTPINSVVIHDPVSSEGCYFISQDIYDPGDDDRVDSLPDTQHKLKKDYLTAGNVFYIWVTDIANMYDSAGGWGATSANSKLGTGTSGTLFNNSNTPVSFSSLKSAYRYNGNNQKGNGYMNSMYTTKWIYDRYVRFPFAVTYYDYSNNTWRTAAAYQWIALSSCTTVDENLQPTSSKISVNTSSGGSNGPNAVKYPFASQDGNTPNMGWVYEFYADTSMQESNSAEIQFAAIANNDPNKGNMSAAVNSTISKRNPSNNNVNNGNRNGTKAPYDSIKNHSLDLVGRIGNLTVEDAGDFRFSELFKVTEDTWLIDGVVHNTISNRPFKVVADVKDILKELADASTNGHATTSVMYKQDTNTAGNTVKVGKADCDFVKFPITPSDNNVKDFKSEAMRMGYALYMDIETIGNYYGINRRTSTPTYTLKPDGSYDVSSSYVSTTINSYDDNDESKGVSSSDPNYYKRTYTTNVDIRYFLLDLDTSEYVPIDVYYGEDGQRKVCFQWNKQLWSDWKQYIELENEFNRRNGTRAERDATLSGNAFLNTMKYNLDTDESNHASNPFDYSRDFIGYADQLILDQKDRTFIGSSLLRTDLTPKDNGMYFANPNCTDAYSWSNVLLGCNTKKLSQQRDSYSYYNDWDPYYIYWSSADTDKYKVMNAKYGISEQEYAAQSQRWHMCVGLPSTAYVVPAQNGPVMNGTTGTKNYLSAYVSGATNYNSQLVLEKAHEALLKKHPNSVVVCAVDITSQGEVWKLRYNSNSNNKQFTVYDGDAEEQPSSIRDKKYNYPKGFEDWTIVSVYEPEYTSYDDLSIYGTH